MPQKMMIVDDEPADLARFHEMTTEMVDGRFKGVAA
jgi:hypothetical protein